MNDIQIVMTSSVNSKNGATRRKTISLDCDDIMKSMDESQSKSRRKSVNELSGSSVDFFTPNYHFLSENDSGKSSDELESSFLTNISKKKSDDDLKDSKTHDTKKELKSELKSELTSELTRELINTITTSLKKEIIDEFKKEFREKIINDIVVELKNNFEMKKKIE